MVEAVWLGQEREGSQGWGAGLRGSGRAGQGTWHRGQDPQGRAADLPGVLRSRVRGGHSLQTKRGRSSAERGGTGWPGGLGGQDGWPGQAGGLGVSSLVGTAPRARCWGGREEGSNGTWGLAISSPRRKLSSVSSFISRPTSSWQWRKEELAAGRNVWRASVARAILGWGQARVRLSCSSDGKESARNAEDLGSIPGSGRSSGEGNGNPLQYSCLENPKDRGAWQATVCGVTKSRTGLSDHHHQGSGTAVWATTLPLDSAMSGPRALVSAMALFPVPLGNSWYPFGLVKSPQGPALCWAGLSTLPDTWATPTMPLPCMSL